MAHPSPTELGGGRMGSLGIDFPFMVGPMVGLTHVAFRELIRGYVPRSVDALLFTEMLSTRRLPSQHLDEVEHLYHSAGESFLVPQLLGNEERFIAPSIQKLLPMKPWGFDINMGCPVTQTLKHNWGVLLMGDMEYAGNVVRATKCNSPLPVSVKLRAGNDEKSDIDYLLRFTETLEKAGADWLTIHCRTRGQKHKGEADWTQVGRVAKARSIPVVANGDIQTASDALKVMEEFGADGAMVGRAATARPWILWQIAHLMGIKGGPPGRENETPPMTLEEESREYFRACLRYLDLLDQYFVDNDSALKKFRFFINVGKLWFFYGHHFSVRVLRAKTISEARTLLLEYAAKEIHPIRSRIQFA